MLHAPRDGYLDAAKAITDDGYAMCVDLTAVDYLGHPGRPLPEGVARRALRGRRQLPRHRRRRGGCGCGSRCPSREPALPTLFDLHPGTEAMEREVYDMFGISFNDHPDMTRILMPEDWEGHPLRKDYAVGSIPVQFKDATVSALGIQVLTRRHVGSWHQILIRTGSAEELHDRHGRADVGGRPGAQAAQRGRRGELMREVGAVLRMSEAEAAQLGDLPVDPDEDQTMIINMGPQHPSTHGVLRLMLELQGETVLRCKPIIGYLHTGMEKTAEQLTYLQGGTNVTRMDYLSPFFNELAFSMATEKLLGIDEDIPERATWIRMLISELNRMSSHLLFLATNGMDLGAVSMMIYGWREREEVLRFFQKVTGLRMNHNYVRPGGVAADLPPGWRDDVLRLLDLLPEASGRVRHADDGPADLARPPAGRRPDHADRGRRPRRDRARPALDRRRVGHPPGHAVPALPGGRVRRPRRFVRRRLRPLRDPPQRGPRVDAHRRARCSTGCRPATTASRTRR